MYLFLLQFFGLLYCIFEFSFTLTLGWFIFSDVKKTFALNQLKTAKFGYNLKVLHTDKSFFSPGLGGLSILSKWYLNGIGRVPRWSSLHNAIEKKYNELLLEKK